MPKLEGSVTPDRWERLKEVFGEAVDKPAPERERFLSNACQGNSELLAQALRLIAGHDRAGDFLSDPAITLSANDEPHPQFATGQLVVGRFRIVRFIARGGMGEVYEAEDLTLGTKVALKAIHPRITGETALGLFKQEILSARRVTHPNVCRIYDIAEHTGEHGDSPVTLLTMELLEGPTLSRHLKDHGPFSRNIALPLIQQICAGLQAAHDAGVVHRDFKSSNVILTQHGDGWRPVITDFGLALPAGSGPEPQRAHGGTPGYVAPEQIRGGPATPATDVYALGVVIGRMIGSSRARKPRTLKPGELSDATQVPTNSRLWKGVIERCLEPDPARRYQRPAKVAVALRRSSLRWSHSLKALLASALAGLLVLFWVTHPSPPGPREVVNRRVWSGNAVDKSGSVSPDGNLLSFTDWETGDLLVHDFKTGENRRFTNNKRTSRPEFQFAASSIFSRDGQWLAYSWQPPGDGTPMGVRLIRRDGSGQRTIYQPKDQTWLSIEDWSQDRKYLLVTAQQASGTRLVLVSAADGTSRDLPVAEDRYGGTAKLSPDGQYAVYDGRQGDGAGSEVRVISLVNGGDAPLLAHPGNESVVGWAPDGERLIFRSMRSGAYEIWDVLVVNGHAQGVPQRLPSNVDSFSASLGLTRKGSLFYATDSGASDVFFAEFDSSSGKLLPSKVLSERFVGTKTSPAWSPDGSSVVYVAKNMLRLHSMLTGAERDISPKMSRLVRVLEWSPDGRSIFVQGFSGDGKGGTFRVDLKTGAVRVILPGIVDREAFSRDSRTIYTWGGPALAKHIVSTSLRTGKQKSLYTREAVFEIQNPNLSLSPNGKMLALQLQGVPRGHNSLAIMPVTGGEPRIILTIPQPERFGANSFTWSKDLRYIFATRLLKNHSEIWRVPVDDGPQPSALLSMAGEIRQLHLNPNGHQFIFTSAQGAVEIWALENFLSQGVPVQEARR
ncbi:MAG: serine/threonine-protein kinase [Acidobacteriota bacterium]|nr:serine/threonine-protein kinase [Acidobacteriota bacterium]